MYTEVEPLGDVRWARIEQSLMQRLDSELPAAEPTPAHARGRALAGSNALGSNVRSRTWPLALVADLRGRGGGGLRAPCDEALGPMRPPPGS